MKKIVLVLGLLCSPFAAAQPLTAVDQQDVYRSCSSSCVTSQRSKPGNQAVRDRPFLFDAYCSCHCARTVQRMSKTMVIAVAKAQQAGRMAELMRRDAGYRQLVEQNAEICRAALFGD